MKKLSVTNKHYYFLSLGAILLLSFYPIFMGVKLLSAYISDGHVNVTDYPKYVIPYTPIAIALILSAVLMPAAVKLFKRFALPAVSVFGTGIFLLSEIMFEQVTVFYGNSIWGIDSWQAFTCYMTPEAMRMQTTVGEALAIRYSPIFKLHFYLIAILIVLAVIGVVYGFGNMIREKNYGKKKPLIIQTAAVGVFIGLCILACFTSFYRTGELNISAVSSWLMSVFFIVFGLTAGVYTGSLLYFKKPAVSGLLPALIASATTLIMYIGELVLMGGVLFKFGDGFLFDPIGGCPFAPVDFIVILMSGVITCLILFLIRRREEYTQEPLF